MNLLPNFPFLASLQARLTTGASLENSGMEAPDGRFRALMQVPAGPGEAAVQESGRGLVYPGDAGKTLPQTGEVLPPTSPATAKIESDAAGINAGKEAMLRLGPPLRDFPDGARPRTTTPFEAAAGFFGKARVEAFAAPARAEDASANIPDRWLMRSQPTSIAAQLPAQLSSDSLAENVALPMALNAAYVADEALAVPADDSVPVGELVRNAVSGSAAASAPTLADSTWMATGLSLVADQASALAGPNHAGESPADIGITSARDGNDANIAAIVRAVQVAAERHGPAGAAIDDFPATNVRATLPGGAMSTEASGTITRAETSQPARTDIPVLRRKVVLEPGSRGLETRIEMARIPPRSSSTEQGTSVLAGARDAAQGPGETSQRPPMRAQRVAEFTQAVAKNVGVVAGDASQAETQSTPGAPAAQIAATLATSAKTSPHQLNADAATRFAQPPGSSTQQGQAQFQDASLNRDLSQSTGAQRGIDKGTELDRKLPGNMLGNNSELAINQARRTAAHAAGVIQPGSKPAVADAASKGPVAVQPGPAPVQADSTLQAMRPAGAESNMLSSMQSIAQGESARRTDTAAAKDTAAQQTDPGFRKVINSVSAAPANARLNMTPGVASMSVAANNDGVPARTTGKDGFTEAGGFVTDKGSKIENLRIVTTDVFSSNWQSPATASGAGAVPTYKLPAAPGSERWSQALGERVVLLLRGEQHTARLSLNPEHLGPLEVQLRVRDDQAQLWIHAQHQQARDALDTALPRLRDMLAEQGLTLARDGARAGSGDQGNDNNPQHRFASSPWQQQPAVEDVSSDQPGRRGGHDGMVDHYV